MVCTVLRFRAVLPFIVVRFCTWWAYICQSVLLTLICQLALTFMWSHGHCARWSSGCPMQVASAVSACHPCLSNKTSWRQAACSQILQVTVAQHLCPVEKTDIVLALGEFSAQRHGPRALLYIDIKSISNLHNKQFFSTYMYYALIPETSLFTYTHRGAIYQPSWSAESRYVYMLVGTWNP